MASEEIQYLLLLSFSVQQWIPCSEEIHHHCDHKGQAQSWASVVKSWVPSVTFLLIWKMSGMSLLQHLLEHLCPVVPTLACGGYAMASVGFPCPTSLCDNTWILPLMHPFLLLPYQKSLNAWLRYPHWRLGQVNPRGNQHHVSDKQGQAGRYTDLAISKAEQY